MDRSVALVRREMPLARIVEEDKVCAASFCLPWAPSHLLTQQGRDLQRLHLELLPGNALTSYRHQKSIDYHFAD
jgi:hypothetical protein